MRPPAPAAAMWPSATAPATNALTAAKASVVRKVTPRTKRPRRKARLFYFLLPPIMLKCRQMIHPTAVIHPQAKLDASVQVGPYAVIDEHVALGPDCVVSPHVHLT